MKGKLRRLLAAWLAILLLLGSTAALATEDDSLISERTSQGLKGLGEKQTDTENGDDTSPVHSGDGHNNYNTTTQLTEEDLIRMNHGVVTILYSDEGYITFLQGKYYEGKVTNSEDAVDSLAGVAGLLGLGKGSEFYSVFGYRSRSGYTIYTYQQRYGDTTLQNAVLKIVVDPDGYTAGLISSMTPNVGVAPENVSSISADQAEQIVLKQFPNEKLTIFSQYTRQTSITINNVANHVWAVFTNYPTSATQSDYAYLEHYVAYEGTYFGNLPVITPEEYVPGDNALQESVLHQWFDGMEPATWTGTVKTHDGTKQLTVPIMRGQNGTYYLGDAQRHILLADYYEFAYNNRVIPWISNDNTGWPDAYLLTYATYIKIYDFFAEHNYESIDGFGTPILILTDMCDENHVPVDNAVYMGQWSGWEVVAATDVNAYGECVDVCAHEFTHGIKRYATTGSLYQNEAGAVDEALSDVIGNLCELLMGETTDTEWLLAENSGRPLRSMSFPWQFRQPAKLGGRYYYPNMQNPTLENDYGGVHINSSLINSLAWGLYALGMDPLDEFFLWMHTINLLTPYSGFKEVHSALLFAADMMELDIEWYGRIDMLCEQLGF